jgi:hypothetical protein
VSERTVETHPVERWTLGAVMLATYRRLGLQLPPASASDYERPEAPSLFKWLFSSQPLQFVLLGILVVAMLQFARRRRALLWGTVALVIGAFESESRIALNGQYEMEFAGVGAVLAGWLFGLAFARDSGDTLSEETAAAGARGVFAAMYLAAGIDHVRWWVDARYLMVSAVVRGPFDSDVQPFVGFHLQHPLVPKVMVFAGIGVELASFLFLLGPRIRAVWGTAVVLLHLYAYLLLDLKYVDPPALALAFSYRWVRPTLAPESGPAPSLAKPLTRSLGRIGALGAVVLFAASWAHHVPRFSRPPDPQVGSNTPAAPAHQEPAQPSRR